MIQNEFAFSFLPQYHGDIVNMESCYIKPERNCFFLAIDHETRKIIGTMGIRAYDKDFDFFKHIMTQIILQVSAEFLWINIGEEMGLLLLWSVWERISAVKWVMRGYTFTLTKQSGDPWISGFPRVM